MRYRSLVRVGLLACGASFALADDPAPQAPPPDDAPAEQFDEADRQPVLPRKARAAGLATTPGVWLPQGPSPTTDGQVEGIPPNDPVVGAIHVVAAHPTNPEVLFLGAANGGIWRTSNAGAPSPTWTPLTDAQASLSISALEFDPTDPTAQTLLGGIGRYSSFAQAGGRLAGLLRTTDGGATWTAIEHPLLEGQNVSGVAARGPVLVASANFFFGGGGLFRSTDTGASWTRVDGAPGSGLPSAAVHDLVGDPSDPERLYAAVRFHGIFRSDDAGATWTEVSSADAALDATLADPRNNNAELAVAPDGRLYVAALLNGQAAYIGYTDGPADPVPAWTRMDLPLTPEGGSASISNATNTTPIVITTAAHGLPTGRLIVVSGVLGNTAANGVFRITVVGPNSFSLDGSAGNGAYAGSGHWQTTAGLNPRENPGSQGGIHFSIAAGPAGLWVGGDRQDSPFPNFVGAFDFTGRLFRGDPSVAPASTAPSPQWKHLTHSNLIGAIPGGGTASRSAPHADARELVLDAGGELVESDDGGIYRRTLPESNAGDWFSLNGNLQVTEFHDIAYDTLGDVILGGAQDTGTPQQTAAGSLQWRSVSTADGGDVAVNDAAPDLSVRYSSFQFLGSFRRRVYDADNMLVAESFPPLTLTLGSPLATQFVTPIAVNAVDPVRLLIGGGNSVYESPNEGLSIAEVGPGIPVGALAYGGRRDGVSRPEVAYVGSGGSLRVRTVAAGPFLATTAPFPGGTVRDIALDPEDWMTAYVIGPSDVFRTTNAGASWTSVTGDLPIEDLRTVVFLPGAESPSVAVGGRAGVAVMRADAPGTWRTFGTGLPHAPVWDMDHDAADDVLVVGTLGRGAWLLPHAACTAEGDRDGDGFCNARDNCPDESNPDQVDAEADGLGDACDVDDDDDGVHDAADNCRTAGNADQADADLDGVGEACDNCVGLANGAQENADGDERGDLCDCATADPSAFAVVGAIDDLRFHGRTAFTWSSAIPGTGSGTRHDVFRGALDELPVGSGPSEQCLATELQAAEFFDFDDPAPGRGFWYLVQGKNACGAGSLGGGLGSQPVLCLGCPHHRCETGAPLDPSCDPCVGRVCDLRPACCTTSWDAACVTDVLLECGSAICPDNRGGCAHGLCATGAKLVAGCDAPPAESSCATAVCNADPFCCGFAWDANCVRQVPQRCGLSCNGAEREPNGVCATTLERIAAGTSLVAEIAPACDFDAYKAELSTATELVVETRGSGDLALQLVDCDTDAVIACDDEGAGSGQPRIAACLPAGDYCYRVRPVAGATTFVYFLEVSGGAACVPQAPPAIEADGCPNGDLSGNFDACP